MSPTVNPLKRSSENDDAKRQRPISMDLSEEISMLRYAIRRVFACAQDEEQQDLGTWGNALTTLSIAASRLGRLLKTQKDLSGGESDSVVAMLHRALKEINREEGN